MAKKITICRTLLGVTGIDVPSLVRYQTTLKFLRCQQRDDQIDQDTKGHNPHENIFKSRVHRSVLLCYRRSQPIVKAVSATNTIRVTMTTSASSMATLLDRPQRSLRAVVCFSNQWVFRTCSHPSLSGSLLSVSAAFHSEPFSSKHARKTVIKPFACF